MFDVAVSAVSTTSPFLLQVGERLMCAGEERTVIERREFVAKHSLWVELTLQSPGNRLIVEVSAPDRGREAMAWRRLGKSIDTTKVYSSSITLDNTVYQLVETGHADFIDSQRVSLVEACEYRLFTAGDHQLKYVRILNRKRSEWAAQCTSDLDVSDLRSMSENFTSRTYHVEANDNHEIGRLIDSIPQTLDLTSPLRAKVGDRITWKNDEYVVALRTDCAEQNKRSVRLIAQSSARECRIELKGGPHGIEAREWHRLKPLLISAERMMRGWITVDGVSHQYQGSAELFFRAAAGGPEAVAGALEVRTFALQDQRVNCERSAESGEIEWSVSYPDDRGDIALVTNWSGRDRPF